MATINGTTGNDTLLGTASADTISGLGGNDRLQANEGDDTVLGGAGNDTVRGNAGTDWVEGGAGNDNVGGGEGVDRFVFREAGSANADEFNDFLTARDNIQLDAAFFTALGGAGQFSSGDARFWSSTTGAAHDANDRVIYNTSTRELWYDADGNGAGAAQLIGTLNSGATIVATDLWVFGTPPGGGGQTINGTAGNDSLVGGSANDTINGLAGFDTIDGGAGADSMIGGADDDIFIVDNTGDVVVEQNGGGSFDEVRASVTYTLPAWVNNLTLTGTAATWGTGNELDNIITGNSGFNGISGGAGNDMISGGDGEDSLGGGEGDDTIRGNEDEDFIVAGYGNDSIDGGRGLDTIQGGAGDDTMLGGTHSDRFYMLPDSSPTGFTSGNDSIDGGDGFDWIDFHYQSGGNQFLRGITVDLTIGGAQDPGVGFAEIAGIEAVQGSFFSDLIRGDGNANEIRGGSGIDTLAGGGGNDTLSGGEARDEFIFDVAPGAGNADTITDFGTTQDWITLDGLAHVDTGPSGFFDDTDARFWSSTSGGAHDANDRVIYNTTTGQLWYDADGNGSGAAQLIATLQGAPGLAASDIQVVNGSNAGAHIVGTNGNDSLAGTSGNDWIEGLAGDDTLDGIQGQDTLDGGTGNDTYFVEQSWSDVILDAGGTDLVIGKRFGVMDAGIENLTLRGTWDTITDWPQVDGNALDNVITNDTALFAMLDGGDGNDALIGGGGHDQFLFSAGSGNYGNDSVNGGAGHDLLDFQSARSAVVIDFSAGTVTGGGAGGSGAVTFTFIETAISSRFDDRLVAHDGGGVLRGYLGNDTLIGGAGNDMLNGDGYWNDHGEDGPGGHDQLFGGAGNDIFMQDGGGDDLLDGGTGDDVFSIGAGDFGAPQGNDTIIGGEGNDTLNADDVTFADLEAGIVDNGRGSVATLSGIENLAVGFGGVDGRILGSSVANALSGGSARDTIEGRAGNDTIDGGFSDDRLDGGAGNDSLIGGAGADSFYFTVAPGAANADQISDFASADDQIVLDGAVYANSGPSGTFAAGDARFWSSSTGAAHDGSDRVIYNTSTGQLWYDADGDNAGAAQLIATLQGAPSVAAIDIAVVNGGSGGATIEGTSGNDSLAGGPGNDTINGLGGNDLFLAGSTGGADVMDGGAGLDSIEFKNAATSAVVVDFGAGTISGGSAGGSISFSNLERVVTGNFNDSLTGNAAGQNLTGQAGNDTIAGAGGVDTLWGGAGNDFFVFREMGTANADRISDWVSGTDKVQLDDAAFAAIGALGDFGAGDARFWAAAGATAGHDANDRVIYNTSTGGLYYDADGNGSGAAQLVATLIGNPAIAATDIAVI